MSDTAMKKDFPEMETIRRLALMVEYEGTRYHGFQYQKNSPSVQGELEEALYSLTGERRRINGAGRTDAGVHALGQVVAFDTWASYPPEVFTQALNSYLPEDISVRESLEVPLDFDPRRGALSREYRYQILNNATPSPLLRGFTHLVRRPLDSDAMDEAARLLEGERDFAPFSGPLPAERGGSTRRVYRCYVRRQGDMIVLTMVASGFLPQQVRRTAGALLDVGLGRMSLQQFSDLAACNIPGVANRALPPRGLFLVRVSYPDLRFSAEDAGDLWEHTVLAACVR